MSYMDMRADSRPCPNDCPDQRRIFGRPVKLATAQRLSKSEQLSEEWSPRLLRVDATQTLKSLLNACIPPVVVHPLAATTCIFSPAKSLSSAQPHMKPGEVDEANQACHMGESNTRNAPNVGFGWIWGNNVGPFGFKMSKSFQLPLWKGSTSSSRYWSTDALTKEQPNFCEWKHNQIHKLRMRWESCLKDVKSCQLFLNALRRFSKCFKRHPCHSIPTAFDCSPCCWRVWRCGHSALHQPQKESFQTVVRVVLKWSSNLWLRC